MSEVIEGGPVGVAFARGVCVRCRRRDAMYCSACGELAEEHDADEAAAYNRGFIDGQRAAREALS